MEAATLVRRPPAREPPIVRALLLLLVALLVCVRMPEVLLKGRFWAEEGSVFFANAFAMPPLAALFNSYGGYLNLVANAATLAASRAMPLAAAPYLTIAVALFFQLLPPGLLLTARDAWLGPLRTRLAGVLLILLVPASEEVWLQTLHCQFHLTLACAILLAIEAPGGRAAIARAAILLLAPLCGPGAIVLLPLFVLRAAADRDARRLLQGLVLAAGSAVQLLFFTHSFAGRAYAFDPATLLGVVAIRHLVEPLLGIRAAYAMALHVRAELAAHRIPVFVVLAPVLVFVPLAAIAWREPRAAPCRWLLCAAALTAAAAYFGALDGTAPLIDGRTGARYVFVPQALLGLAILALAATAPPRIARVAWAATIWLLAVGAVSYRSTAPFIADGPAWSAEVAAWRQDRAHVIRAWPVAHTVRLAPAG